MDNLKAVVPTIVYANDPLCGWCFAIGPSLNEARRRLGSAVDWRVECGGLVVGERIRPIALDREYLRAGLAQVEQASGRRATDTYYRDVVEPGTWVSASEPACRAVLIVQEMAGTPLAMDFSHALTDALYLDGRVPDAPETVHDVALALGLDGPALIERWSSPTAPAATQSAFQRARALGVTTYPSLFLAVNGVSDGAESPVARSPKLLPLLEGFATADTIESIVRAALNDASTNPSE
jgi:putative protein-disulfide isomerase